MCIHLQGPHMLIDDEYQEYSESDSRVLYICLQG